jgi:hypothetical protein
LDADEAAYRLSQRFGGGFGFTVRRTATGYQFLRTVPTEKTVRRSFSIGGVKHSFEVPECRNVLIATAPSFAELVKKALETADDLS